MMKYCGSEIVMTFSMPRLTFPLRLFHNSNWIDLKNVNCLSVHISGCIRISEIRFDAYPQLTTTSSTIYCVPMSLIMKGYN